MEQLEAIDKVYNTPYTSAIDLGKDVVSAYMQLDMQHNTKCRKRNLVEYRQVIMWLLEKHKVVSLKKIAKAVGKANHATVLHSKQQINGYIETYPVYKEQLSLIDTLYVQIATKNNLLNHA